MGRADRTKLARLAAGARYCRRHTQSIERGHAMTGLKFPHRRQFLHLAAGAAALPAGPGAAGAKAYPTRPVRWVVGLAPGGAQDTLACNKRSALHRIGAIRKTRCSEAAE